VDSRLRLPLESRLVKTAKDDLLIFCSFAEEKKRRLLKRWRSVEQVALGYSDGRPDLKKVAARLGEMEMTSVLIEGGALLNWTALALRSLTKYLYYAPKILGGGGSVPFASGADIKAQ